MFSSPFGHPLPPFIGHRSRLWVYFDRFPTDPLRMGSWGHCRVGNIEQYELSRPLRDSSFVPSLALSGAVGSEILVFTQPQLLINTVPRVSSLKADKGRWQYPLFVQNYSFNPLTGRDKGNRSPKPCLEPVHRALDHHSIPSSIFHA